MKKKFNPLTGEFDFVGESQEDKNPFHPYGVSIGGGNPIYPLKEINGDNPPLGAFGVDFYHSRPLSFNYNGEEVSMIKFEYAEEEVEIDIEHGFSRYKIKTTPYYHGESCLILLPTAFTEFFYDGYQITFQEKGIFYQRECINSGVLVDGYYEEGLSWILIGAVPDPSSEFFFFVKTEYFDFNGSIAISNSRASTWSTAIGEFATAVNSAIAIGEGATAVNSGIAIGCNSFANQGIAIGGACSGENSISIGTDTTKDNVIAIGPMEIDKSTDTLRIKNIECSGISSGLRVTTYPFPSQRNIEVQENAFTFIWQNITVPAHSEVYARVTVNLNASPAEGQRIALGFVAEGLNVAASAAPLPVVSGVEHSMCLTHWFEEETVISVAVHSTTTAYVTNIVSPLDAKMNGGTELIIKTYA